MRPRRALTIKSKEKTSEFRFKDFQQARQYLYIHLSQSIRVIQLVPEVFEEFSYLSKNPAVEADENSETLFIPINIHSQRKFSLPGKDCFSDLIIFRVELCQPTRFKFKYSFIIQILSFNFQVHDSLSFMIQFIYELPLASFNPLERIVNESEDVEFNPKTNELHFQVHMYFIVQLFQLIFQLIQYNFSIDRQIGVQRK
ncbi:Hypothetical_protein [Hexamita inflata]|uniref:Hypothetical_protein n=1 Tax=Hexamita inflata TaxID=28002 RepID=A0AA86N6L5_9EUKA|nr:Hypothetical protein HINF_LOCUS1356 [Hexamita inflata]